MPTDLENAWDKGFESGYAARDAEIERLKARIDRLEWCGCGDKINTPKCPNCAMIDNLDLDSAEVVERLLAGIREMKDIFEHCDFVQRGRFMDKCDELLRGE